MLKNFFILLSLCFLVSCSNKETVISEGALPISNNSALDDKVCEDKDFVIKSNYFDVGFVAGDPEYIKKAVYPKGFTVSITEKKTGQSWVYKNFIGWDNIGNYRNIVGHVSSHAEKEWTPVIWITQSEGEPVYIKFYKYTEKNAGEYLESFKKYDLEVDYFSCFELF